jgi:hypothetical protein
MAEEIPVSGHSEVDTALRAELATIRKQAQRYLEARFGGDVWYRAPETFQNVLERWIWAVASDAGGLAEECMTAIEQHFSEPTDA